jgi:hypothetical protein
MVPAMASATAASTGVTVTSTVLFLSLLLLNMFMGWWAWRRHRPTYREKRLPAFGILSAVLLAVALIVLASRWLEYLGISQKIRSLLLLPWLVSLMPALLFGVVNLVKPLKRLEGGAGFRGKKGRAGDERKKG